jgi:hypothetical protein
MQSYIACPRRASKNKQKIITPFSNQCFFWYLQLLNRNTETLIYASKEADLEVHVEQTKYIAVSRDHNADRNRD